MAGRSGLLCRDCGQNFMTKAALDVHSKIHWEHKCCKCGDMFPTYGNLDKHLRDIHGAGSYQCHICQKMFFSEAHLHFHITAVHKRGSVKCRKCGEYLISHAALYTHLKEDHAWTPNPQRDYSELEAAAVASSSGDRSERQPARVHGGSGRDRSPMHGDGSYHVGPYDRPGPSSAPMSTDIYAMESLRDPYSRREARDLRVSTVRGRLLASDRYHSPRHGSVDSLDDGGLAEYEKRWAVAGDHRKKIQTIGSSNEDEELPEDPVAFADDYLADVYNVTAVKSSTTASGRQLSRYLGGRRTVGGDLVGSATARASGTAYFGGFRGDRSRTFGGVRSDRSHHDEGSSSFYDRFYTGSDFPGTGKSDDRSRRRNSDIQMRPNNRSTGGGVHSRLSFGRSDSTRPQLGDSFGLGDGHGRPMVAADDGYGRPPTNADAEVYQLGAARCVNITDPPVPDRLSEKPSASYAGGSRGINGHRNFPRKSRNMEEEELLKAMFGEQQISALNESGEIVSLSSDDDEDRNVDRAVDKAIGLSRGETDDENKDRTSSPPPLTDNDGWQRFDVGSLVDVDAVILAANAANTAGSTSVSEEANNRVKTGNPAKINSSALVGRIRNRARILGGRSRGGMTGSARGINRTAGSFAGGVTRAAGKRRIGLDSGTGSDRKRHSAEGGGGFWDTDDVVVEERPLTWSDDEDSYVRDEVTYVETVNQAEERARRAELIDIDGSGFINRLPATGNANRTPLGRRGGGSGPTRPTTTGRGRKARAAAKKRALRIARGDTEGEEIVLEDDDDEDDEEIMEVDVEDDSLAEDIEYSDLDVSLPVQTMPVEGIVAELDDRIDSPVIEILDGDTPDPEPETQLQVSTDDVPERPGSGGFGVVPPEGEVVFNSPVSATGDSANESTNLVPPRSTVESDGGGDLDSSTELQLVIVEEPTAADSTAALDIQNSAKESENISANNQLPKNADDENLNSASRRSRSITPAFGDSTSASGGDRSSVENCRAQGSDPATTYSSSSSIIIDAGSADHSTPCSRMLPLGRRSPGGSVILGDSPTSMIGWNNQAGITYISNQENVGKNSVANDDEDIQVLSILSPTQLNQSEVFESPNNDNLVGNISRATPKLVARKTTMERKNSVKVDYACLIRCKGASREIKRIMIEMVEAVVTRVGQRTTSGRREGKASEKAEHPLLSRAIPVEELNGHGVGVGGDGGIGMMEVVEVVDETPANTSTASSDSPLELLQVALSMPHDCAGICPSCFGHICHTIETLEERIRVLEGRLGDGEGMEEGDVAVVGEDEVEVID